jgi:translation initiation factor IF-2
LTRQERVQAAIRQAEEERMRALEEQRRRSDLEREAALAAEREAREAKRRAGEEEAAAAEAEAATTQAAPASDAETEARAPGAEARPVKLKADAEEDDAERARPGQPAKRKPEVHKPARVKGDERRQSGKLTVVRALEDEDSVRVRSMAALKRAREKERRSHMMPGQAAKQVREVVVPETITVQELANRMAERASDVIKALFKMGVVATLNQSIDQDTAELIVTDFGHMVKRVAESDVEIGLTGGEDVEGDLQPRPPVVTIMGHVDHGKT